MNIAYNVASMSHCVKRKIGAILVKDGRVLSMGWNGMPAGWHNKCEKSPTETRLEVLHAETNMIAKIARSNESAAGAIVYSTYLPCIECAKMLYQSGIVVIYYSEYKTGDHNISGIKFLRKCRVPVIRIKMKNVQNNKNQEEINVVSTRARNQHKKTNNNI
ncbi:MAG: deoxycytidylate deaminase [Nitrosopumilaceae archaeon]